MIPETIQIGTDVIFTRNIAYIEVTKAGIEIVMNYTISPHSRNVLYYSFEVHGYDQLMDIMTSLGYNKQG